MNAAVKIDHLLDEASRASARTGEARDEARVRALRVIRLLEQRVREALAGDVLRGLSSLVPGDGGPSFQAARVGAASRHDIDAYLPEDGREALVLHKSGALMMAQALLASKPTGERWEARPVRDDELRAQDLEPFARAVQQALQRHVARAGRTELSYRRVVDLAQRLAGVVGAAI